MAETLLNQQESKLESGADHQRQNNHLKKIIGVALSIVMIGLTVYVLNLQHQNNSGYSHLLFEISTHFYRSIKAHVLESLLQLNPQGNQFAQSGGQFSQGHKAQSGNSAFFN